MAGAIPILDEERSMRSQDHYARMGVFGGSDICGVCRRPHQIDSNGEFMYECPEWTARKKAKAEPEDGKIPATPVRPAGAAREPDAPAAVA